jgi:hypothetical protein
MSAGDRKPLAASKGTVSGAVLYSLTGAMLPWKKESARRHTAVYILGVGYHLGVFLGFTWLIAFLLDADVPQVVRSLSAGLLALTALCGLALLVRRVADPKLRYFSNPDDYVSNIMVTTFQAVTAAGLIRSDLIPGIFISAGILLLYIPLGKLRHAIYFVLARVYLGQFYGRRGVWPVRNHRRWQQ